MPAVFRRAQRAPRDAVARAVQTSEWTFQPTHLRKHVLLGAEHVVHHDLAGDARAQAYLAVNRRSAQPLPTLLENEPANVPCVVFCPDDEDVGNRTVRDPRLCSGQRVSAGDFLRTRHHAAWVGTVIRFGQAEAADPLAGCELRNELLFQGGRAELVDGCHHERALHAHHRAVPGIDALDLARDEPVAHVAETRTAVLLGKGDGEHVELAELAVDGFCPGALAAKRLEHARCELLLTVSAGRVAHHTFLVRQLLFEHEWVAPVEAGVGGRGHR